MKVSLRNLAIGSVLVASPFASEVRAASEASMPDGLYYASEDGSLHCISNEGVEVVYPLGNLHTFQLAVYSGRLYGTSAGKKFWYSSTSALEGDGKFFYVFKNGNTISEQVVLDNTDGNAYKDPFGLSVYDSSFYIYDRSVGVRKISADATEIPQDYPSWMEYNWMPFYNNEWLYGNITNCFVVTKDKDNEGNTQPLYWMGKKYNGFGLFTFRESNIGMDHNSPGTREGTNTYLTDLKPIATTFNIDEKNGDLYIYIEKAGPSDNQLIRGGLYRIKLNKLYQNPNPTVDEFFTVLGAQLIDGSPVKYEGNSTNEHIGISQLAIDENGEYMYWCYRAPTKAEVDDYTEKGFTGNMMPYPWAEEFDPRNPLHKSSIKRIRLGEEKPEVEIVVGGATGYGIVPVNYTPIIKPYLSKLTTVCDYLTDNVTKEIFKVAPEVMSAIQFDVTVPEGVKFEIPESVASQLTIHKSVIEGNKERYVAYTNDGEALGTEFICTATATNAQRSTLSISNIILSIRDYPVNEEDIDIPVLGYPLSGMILPSVKAGASTYLNTPVELDYDDITVAWKPYSGPIAILTEAGWFRALSQGTIEDLGLTIEDPKVETLLDATATITVYGMIGDADCSGAIDIADVVAVVNYILMKNPEPFDFYYADVDGSGDINVADVTRLIKLVLAQPKAAIANAPMRAQAMSREIKVAADSEGVDSEGRQHLYISLDGDREYTALQLDIELTDGVTIENIKTGRGVVSHVLADARIDESTTRVVLYSLGLEELPAGENLIDVTLAKCVIPDGARVKVSSAISADSEGEAYSHMSFDAALGDIIQGVTDIYTEAACISVDHGTIRVEAQQGVDVRVIDLQGRVVGSWTGSGSVNVARGVYIVTGTGIQPSKVEVR